MSQENVEIVRRLNAPYEGENVVPLIRDMVERLGPDPRADSVLAGWAEDPAWQHAHPEIEWDVRAAGAFGTIAHGPRQLTLWWAEWIEVWESYIYRNSEYCARDVAGERRTQLPVA
jgi:hypothetical protein